MVPDFQVGEVDLVAGAVAVGDLGGSKVNFASRDIVVAIGLMYRFFGLIESKVNDSIVSLDGHGCID